MDFLVTILGNAVVDPLFREKLLANPLHAIDIWGFRLTKGEVEMLQAMLAKRKRELEDKFEALEDVLYNNLREVIPVLCDRPCRMSVSRPLALKKAKPKAA